MKEKINLIYFKDSSKNGNFGDELSKIIVENLINKDKYIITYNDNNVKINLMCIGSYIHMAKNNTYIFGSGIRTPNNLENGHKYSNLNVLAVRGPLSREFLIKKNIVVPEIYGDPALLLPKFYKPIIINNLNNKIGLIPHKSNYKNYINIDINKFYLINPTDNWYNVINYIYSCKYIISSSLHGLICSDSYNKPNLWLDEYPLQEGVFKFYDYFNSQTRPIIKINSLSDFDEKLLYKDGNQINMDKLLLSFPFI